MRGRSGREDYTWRIELPDNNRSHNHLPLNFVESGPLTLPSDKVEGCLAQVNLEAALLTKHGEQIHAEAEEECFLHEYLEERSPATLFDENLKGGLTFVILGAYNGKPPSPGKGGFPFSRILGAHCPHPPGKSTAG